ncbi:hypothetical protein B0H14DRAFT_3516566 [Mycena olivaceomarginata]|nr:hypothetical protein B0H14DRAFT_3516566 [Mycena olivaceomarginata]
MKVSGFSWDANVYDGIHQFHAAKGFDHHSQEVALEVGNPLYQVSYDQESLFAHMQENDGEWYSDSDGMEDGSVTGDEEYNSASSELGDAFPTPEVELDSQSCNGIQDHTHEEEEGIAMANGGQSAVPEKSGAYT